jgi:hypothetical protein
MSLPNMVPKSYRRPASEIAETASIIGGSAPLRAEPPASTSDGTGAPRDRAVSWASHSSKERREARRGRRRPQRARLARKGQSQEGASRLDALGPQSLSAVVPAFCS